MIRASHMLLAAALVTGPVTAQQTIEIPPEQIEALPDLSDLPVPEVRPDLSSIEGFIRSMEDIARTDWTGTLPEAITEMILGASPVEAHAGIVWEMRVAGSWNETVRGTGALNVLNQTALGAARGRQIHAVLDTDARDWPFHLFAFVPDDAPAVARLAFAGAGEGHAGGGTGFSPIANHMFDFDRLLGHATPEGMRARGFSELTDADITDDYLYTEVQGGRIRVDRSGNAYRISFSATVQEFHSDGRRPTGRVANLRGWVCEAAAYEVNPESCLYDGLELVAWTPEHLRENVHFDAPEITFTFSDPVTRESLADAVRVTTRAPDAREIELPGRIEVLDETHYAFRPDERLRDGTVYEITVQGGPDGVQARDSDDYLADNLRWRFSTQVDHFAPAHVDHPPFRLHAYQTVRDAPLVMGKPALMRAYLDWRFHEDIHRDWQVTSYPARITTNQAIVNLRAQFDRAPDEEGAIRIVHPDLFDDAARRHALHTVNMFGWVPEWTGPVTEVEFELTPHDPWPAVHPHAGIAQEVRFDNWPVRARWLFVHYAFLELFSWADGVPLDDRFQALEVVDRAKTLATQMLPIHGTAMYPINSSAIRFTIDEEFVDAGLPDQTRAFESGVWRVSDLIESLGGDPLTLSGEPREIHVMRRALTRVRNVMRLSAQPDDIILLFYPLDMAGYGMAIHEKFSNYGDRGVGLPLTPEFPADVLSMGLVHEFGHALGLSHDPGDAGTFRYSPRQHFDRSIEGFRMRLDGTGGWNKSMEEGNAEAPGVLAPLMWPAVIPESWVWMPQGAYDRALLAFERSPRALRYAMGPAEGARDALLHRASLSEPETGSGDSLVVFGSLHPEGRAASIDHVGRAVFDWPTGTGDMVAELLDEAGTVLAAQPFGPDLGSRAQMRLHWEHADPDDPAWWHDFTVALPDHAAAVRLRLRDGDQVLAEREAPATRPEVALTDAQLDLSKGPARLEWEASGSATLTALVRYSATGQAPWQTRALVPAEAGGVTLDPDELVAGPFPTAQVVVQDGFHEAQAEVAVWLPALPPRPVTTWPTEPVIAPRIGVAFAQPVDPDSLAGNVILKDLAGATVPVRLLLAPGNDRLTLLPEAPLASGETYTATLRARLRAADGTQLSEDFDWAVPVAEFHRAPPPAPAAAMRAEGAPH